MTTEAGVVIGSYRFPDLIRFQVALIRHHCGAVPILVSADVSPEVPRLREICRELSVELEVSPDRLGHTGGDLAAFWRGLHWGHRLGLGVVAKLSQRLVLDTPSWLQDGAEALVASGLPLAGQACRGREVYDFRTEACLLRVPQWWRDDILDALAPRPREVPELAETTFFQQFKKLGQPYLRWPVLSENRFERRPGVLWYRANFRGEYLSLAKRHGVVLGPDFRTEGWGWDREYKR